MYITLLKVEGFEVLTAVLMKNSTFWEGRKTTDVLEKCVAIQEDIILQFLKLLCYILVERPYCLKYVPWPANIQLSLPAMEVLVTYIQLSR
jgi:hypothetical protein